MGVNRFVLNGISYHGHGAINEIPGIIKSKGFKKAFVASDPDLVKFGVTAKVTDLLDQNGIAYEVYSDIKPNPTIENVKSGVEAYKASGADFMITIGGGSSMDTGKGIGIIVNNPEYADVRSLEGVAPTKNRTVFTIAVPTTGGTGAESTINYVITDVEKKRKFVCVDPNDIPDIAVVDPDMMASIEEETFDFVNNKEAVAKVIADGAGASDILGGQNPVETWADGALAIDLSNATYMDANLKAIMDKASEGYNAGTIDDPVQYVKDEVASTYDYITVE